MWDDRYATRIQIEAVDEIYRTKDKLTLKDRIGKLVELAARHGNTL